FFFQAEDGIRDGHVTGVQTCALPISSHVAASGFPLVGSNAFTSYVASAPSGPVASTVGLDTRSGGGLECAAAGTRPVRTPSTARSEERRVGKEWRSRRAAAAWSNRAE